MGLRLETMAASRLTPCWRGRLVEAGTGRTRLEVRLRWPRITALLLWGFTAAILVWGAALARDLWTGQTHAGWLVAWGAVPVFVHAAAAAGWFWGRSRLRSELDWLRQALSRTVVEGEDWG